MREPYHRFPSPCALLQQRILLSRNVRERPRNETRPALAKITVSFNLSRLSSANCRARAGIYGTAANQKSIKPTSDRNRLRNEFTIEERLVPCFDPRRISPRAEAIGYNRAI